MTSHGRIPTLFPWPGGKAALSDYYGAMLIPKIPNGGIYYEGFAGAASVGIWIGHTRPDVHIVLSDTSPHVVRALEYVQQGGPVKKVLQNIRYLYNHEDERAKLMSEWKESQDPVEWLAAVQARHPGELYSWNWCNDNPRLASRVKNLPIAFEKARLALRNAQIIRMPAQVRRCHAAFFDPPYFGAKKVYPGAKGGPVSYAQMAKQQCLLSNIVLVTEYSSAAPLYPDFEYHKLKKPLGGWSKPFYTDTYFVWEKGKHGPPQT